MDRDISPGHFDLPIPINDKNIDKDAVKRKLLDVKHDLESRLGRPEELAIRHVLGLLQFSLKRYEDASEQFRIVLEKDPDNGNAMANMQHLLSKLHRKKDASCFQCQLEEWKLQTISGQATDTAQHRFVRARARCLAEQAYVFAADLHTDKASNERYQQSNDIFNRALQLAGEVIESSDRDFWEYIMARNAHKLFLSFIFSDDRGQADDFLEVAVDLFYGIIQRTPGEPEYQWESWRNLADIFRKLKGKRHLGHSCVKIRELREYIQSDPEECMKKAMEISPNNPRLLARYGNFVYSLKRDTCTKRALELLDKSISLDNSDYNFYAFSVRGMINLKSYQWQLRKSKEDNKRYFPPGQHILEKASVDFEKAITFRNTSWDLMNLANVQFLMAQNFTETTDFTRRRCIKKAFEFLRQAEDSNDQPGVMKDVSRYRGRIYFDLGEYREAIEYFTTAVDNEPPSTQFTGYFHELFRSFLCLLHVQSEESEALLDEMACSLKKALIKYGGGNLIKLCFGRLREEYKDELQLFTAFCEKIPRYDDLLFVLKSKEQKSPGTPPIRKGGTLKEMWVNSTQPTSARPKTGTLRPVNLEARFEALSETPTSPGNNINANSTALDDTGDKSGILEETGSIEPLLSGIRSLTIKNPSGSSDQAHGAQRAKSQSDTEFSSRPPGSLGAGKETTFEYDFYVVHAESDQDWVEHKLLHELETVRKLKGCTYARDCPPGSYIPQGSVTLMKQSACFLLIITKDFKKSKECEYNTQHALKLRDIGHGVVPIKVDGSDVLDELHVLKCFDASKEGVNWDKLARSIKQ